MRKYILIGLVLVGAVGTGTMLFLKHSSGPAITFRTEQASRGELLATVGGTGTLEPEDVIDVGSQVAGLIQDFGTGLDGKPIDYGSPVDAGTVLARIDDSLFAAKAEQSRTLLKSAESKVVQAKAKAEAAVANTNKARADWKQAIARSNQSTRDWDRARSLKPTGAIADSEFDADQGAFEINVAAVASSEAAINQFVAAEADAKAAVGDAEAAVATAKAILQQDEINLGYCVIKSNVKGTIIDRRVTIGQTVQASFNTPSLFLIAKDLHRMKVWASVNEADIGQVKVGQPVRFSVDAYPTETFQGTVGRIRLNATNTQNVVVYTVEVVTDNPDGRLLPYMTANLKFEVDRRKDALLVPNAALRYRPAANLIAGGTASRAKDGDKEKPGQGVVWVAEGNKVRPITVKLGLTDGNFTEVLDGELKDGMALVVAEARNAAPASAGENPFAQQRAGGKKQ
ncbi:efflux RND transporter periplasmic adaptor subunit [Zavarzinella formosa]|uniref:efflux RND transporter periplasmic adaptor subunit n=1 Tax=Zavarzinella formosa TaxID=360055 RepID=UPI00036A74F1|nr:efflux RND transporter periplasmic adaptor subunit [Zavarzinella formosa]